MSGVRRSRAGTQSAGPVPQVRYSAWVRTHHHPASRRGGRSSQPHVPDVWPGVTRLKLSLADGYQRPVTRPDVFAPRPDQAAPGELLLNVGNVPGGTCARKNTGEQIARNAECVVQPRRVVVD